MHDRGGIETAQIARLRALLGELSGANRFYGSRLHAGGTVCVEVPTLDAFRTSMPFTQKAELVEDQRRHPPYGSNLTYSLDLLHPVQPHQRHHRQANALAGHAGKLAMDARQLGPSLLRRPASPPGTGCFLHFPSVPFWVFGPPSKRPLHEGAAFAFPEEA